jgi:hypothetical protein
MTDVYPPPYYQPGDRVFIKSYKNDWYVGRIYEVLSCDVDLVYLKGVASIFSVDQLVPEHEVTGEQIGNLTFLPECSNDLLKMYQQEGLLFQSKDGKNFVIEHKTAIEHVFIPADICGGPTDKDHMKRLYETIGCRTWMVAATVTGSGEYEISLYDGDEDKRIFHHIEIDPEEIIPCPFRRWKKIFQV